MTVDNNPYETHFLIGLKRMVSGGERVPPISLFSIKPILKSGVVWFPLLSPGHLFF
jgi:hypothetical protein